MFVFDIDGTVLVDVFTPDVPIRDNVVKCFDFIKHHGIKFAFNTARVDKKESRDSVRRFVTRLVGWCVPDSLIKMRPEYVLIKNIPECKADNMDEISAFFKSTKAETVLFDDIPENLEAVASRGYCTSYIDPKVGVNISNLFDVIYNQM